jgi:hypothetical protein
LQSLELQLIFNNQNQVALQTPKLGRATGNQQTHQYSKNVFCYLDAIVTGDKELSGQNPGTNLPSFRENLEINTNNEEHEVMLKQIDPKETIE